MTIDINSKDKAIHKDFRRVFYKREGKELLGNKNKNLLVLIAILFITFSAIGFASGSLKYLKKKMDDPYIKWVNVGIPYFMNDEGEIIKDKLNNDSLAKQKYQYKNVTAYFRFPIAFYSHNLNGTVEKMGRSIDVYDPILNEIFKKANKIKGRPFIDENDIGIIVTEEFLSLLGYDINAAVVNMSLSLGEDNQEFVPIPIIAVLKELPGMSMFATTPYFRQLQAEPAKGSPFRRNGTEEIIVFIPGDSVTGYALNQSVTNFFEKSYTELSPWITISETNRSYQTGYDVSVSFIGDLSITDLDSIYYLLANSIELEKFRNKIIRFYDYKTYLVNTYTNYDYLAINFEELSQVRVFKDYFFKKYQLKIDIAQIEAKENYSYVSKLTLIISFILIIFSVLVITMFVSNILSRHLDKIKSNIGTFKAFGLSNKDLLSIYLTLSLWFVSSAMMVAILFSLLFGYFGGVRFGLSLVNATIEPGEIYFHLFNWWILISIIMILIASTTVIYFTANTILKRTPGDLIYNRQ